MGKETEEEHERGVWVMMRTRLINELVKKFGPAGSGPEAVEMKFDCPKCGSGQQKYNLYVNTRKLLFYCFRCHWKGHLKDVGITVENSLEGLRLVHNDRTELDVISPIKIDGFELIKESDAQELLFLSWRGISLDRALEMGVGVSHTCPRLWRRVIIPCFEDGIIVSYTARAAWKGMEPKTLYPTSEEAPTKRSDTLHGLDELNFGDLAIFVEGIFDSERIRRWRPIVKPLALGGTQLSDVQLGKTLAKNPRSIHVMLDGDQAGYQAVDKIARKIHHRYKGEVKVHVLEEGKDPDDLSDAELDKLFHSVV